MTKIREMHIVTKPTPVSTIGDICIHTDIKGLYLQFMGGLKPEEIHGIYTGKQEARRIARWLLSERKS